MPTLVTYDGDVVGTYDTLGDAVVDLIGDPPGAYLLLGEEGDHACRIDVLASSIETSPCRVCGRTDGWCLTWDAVIAGEGLIRHARRTAWEHLRAAMTGKQTTPRETQRHVEESTSHHELGHRRSGA